MEQNFRCVFCHKITFISLNLGRHACPLCGGNYYVSKYGIKPIGW